MNKLIPIFIVILAAFAGCANMSSDYRSEIIKYEGYSEVSYRDRGGYSVGVGHHIYGKVKHAYSRAEVEAFFQADLRRNLAVCREGIERFDDLPLDVRQVCIGIAWGVGPNGFMKFVRFRAALSIRDYLGAVNELEQSKWFYQVSLMRSTNYISILKNHHHVY